MLWKVLTSSWLCLLIFGENVHTAAANTDTPPFVGSQRAESQSNFYPSFPPFQNQPLGHSRPFLFNQPEAAYSQRSQSPFNQPVPYDSHRYNAFKDDSYTSSSDSLGLLGSGNFGVIRGGTFYAENDGQGGASGGYTDDYNSYFHNGHGRPDFNYGNNNPKPYQHEQFANFRDFADINVPTDRQYSHYVVVYVNKNGTRQEKEVVESVKKPKNIIESLAMLDEAEEVGTTVPATVDDVPEKKLSKSKRKLAKLLPEKKYKVKKTVKKIARDLNEPLLALS